MNKEKEIKEFADEIRRTRESYFGQADYLFAKKLFEDGYRKQSVGQWIKDEESKFEHRYHCSVCNFYLIGEPTKYCEDCGAKMKGGAD